jgi:peptidyl-prolyl cis-trans isomerase D
MSVIQKIQDKYAKLMAIIIALALITFVVMLAFENKGGLFFNQNSNSVGKVNGEEIDGALFNQRVDQQEEAMKAQNYGQGPALRQQAIEMAWNREINRMVMASELRKLGMKVGKKELGDILYGDNPPQFLKQSFTDPQTGLYNAREAKSRIDQMLKTSPAQQKAEINSYIEEQAFQRLNDKYNSLLGNSINFPKWLIEKQNADNSQLARISFVREVYTSIPDSSIKITDKEIEEYINKHKEEYKQEEGRSISYVSFSALPTAADSASAKQKLLDLRPEFDSTHDMKLFLESQGGPNFYDGYINGNRIQVPQKDSIIKIPVNSIYGPYLDASTYSIAKLLGVRTQPDSVTFRHILIGTTKADQSGQPVPIRDSATAYKLADSIRLAVASGSNFDTLVAKFSDDEGSKAKGGVYEKRVSGEMVAEFNDYIFGNPVGSKGIVNTQFGSHYIEIMSQKGSSPAYKIAYMTVPIEPSSETDANANGEATKFAANSRDQKSFNGNAEKLKVNGINKMVQQDIPPNGYQIQGAGISRELVRNIYKAKLGEVLEPVRVGDYYVVAMVTDISEKGTMSVMKARPTVEVILRNHKKAEQLIKKVGNVTTLEAAATALGSKPIETADSLRFSGYSATAVSSEFKVIGASFNPANKGKVTPPIEGSGGVYVVRVDNVTATALADANVAAQRQQQQQQAQMQHQQMMMQGMNPALEALQKAATVKDNRSKFY